MNPFFRILPRRAVFLAAIVILFISALAIHAGFVQGNAAIRPVAGTTPVIGATVTLVSVRSIPHYKLTVTTTTDSKGYFSFTPTGYPNFPIESYTFSITPALTFTTQGRAVTSSPFPASAAFTAAYGIMVNGNVVQPAHASPIGFQSNQTLTINVPESPCSTISGTITK